MSRYNADTCERIYIHILCNIEHIVNVTVEIHETTGILLLCP